MSNATTHDRPARLLSVLLPLLVIVGWWRVTSDRAARVELSAEAKAIDATLASVQPEVVVLGNSASFHAVDATELGRALGMPGKVAKIFVPASRSSAWYALLENRILEGGHHPKLVLVIGALHHMLDTALGADQVVALRGQLGPGDEHILQKALGTSPWKELTSQSRQRAEAWFEAPKLAAVGLVYGASGGATSLTERGRAVAEPALARVFDLAAGTDMALHKRVLPVAVGNNAEAVAVEGTMSLEGSFVGDMAALARERGVRIVFVSFPMPASNPTPRPGVEWQRGLVELLNEHDAGWLDLSQVPLPPSAWVDHIHLHAAGRKQFTAALVEALGRLNPLADEGMAEAMLPLAAQVARVGTPDPPATLPPPRLDGCKVTYQLPELAPFSNKDLYTNLMVGAASPLVLMREGAPLRPHVQPQNQACDDTFTHGTGAILASVAGPGTLTLGWSDAAPALVKLGGAEVPMWWVYPGTSVKLDLAEPWDPQRGPFRVEVAVQAPAGGAYVVRAAGEERPLSIERGANGVVVLEGPPPTGPWAIEIGAPSGGKAALVRSVLVGEGALAVSLLGQRQEQGLRVLGQRHLARTVTAQAPPPALTLPALRAGKTPGPHPIGRIELQALSPLSPAGIHGAAGVGGCTPLTVLEDDQPLRVASVGDVTQKGLGTYAVQPSGVIVAASDNSDPATNGRRYTVALSAERLCAQAAWVYPGDVVEVVADPIGPLPEGAARLDLTAAAFLQEEPVGGAHVRVEVDGALSYDAFVPVATLVDGARLPLSPPIPRGAKRLAVRLTGSDDAPYLLFVGLSLVPGEPAASP